MRQIDTETLDGGERVDAAWDVVKETQGERGKAHQLPARHASVDKSVGDGASETMPEVLAFVAVSPTAGWSSDGEQRGRMMAFEVYPGFSVHAARSDLESFLDGGGDYRGLVVVLRNGEPEFVPLERFSNGG